MNRDDLLSVIEGAVRAPSVHNTQPWRFAAHQAASGELDGVDVFADRGRVLEVIDPDGRELHISCGAAIEFARVTARDLGLSCVVYLLPDEGDPDHLARLEISAHASPTAEELRLGRALGARYTERGRFEDRPVPDDLVEELRREAETATAWIRVLDHPGDEIAAAVLLSRADEAERSDPEYGRELSEWYRTEPGAADGIEASALPSTPVEARASSFRLRDFDVAPRATPLRDPDAEPPPAEHPLVIILGTAGDDRRAWLQAGQALGRILLRAAAEGVSASPMTQVLEVRSTRQMLTYELGLLGHPQMVLRMGYGSGHPISPRRPVSEVLTA